ncbi:lactonase family protein [Dictyobacter arantiisoli]|uniref:6-phosphogluconolactonase n=1 Tax=Dictyobacter arantiisoli TaxID=2014874 RepID=A0A5A5TK36_9CHLR|nr:lactonase family protein [Dictyobacter arantiisoli]GCF11383.1 6-phosphogluconolactonase [Dictyobacter arantiisoli]
MNIQHTSNVYIGTYANQQDPGIFLYTLDTDTGTLTYIDSIAGIENPSFLAHDQQQRYLYAVSETLEYQGQAGGSVATFAIDNQAGQLTFLNQQPTLGEDPCFLTLDGNQRFLVLNNYTGGSICLYPLQANGEIGPLADKIQHHGSSLDPQRQSSAHPHSCTFDPAGNAFLVADLGLDKIITYHIDAEQQKFIYQAETASKPGAGPRHMAFHPSKNYAYVINELASTITAYSFDPITCTLDPIQSITTLPVGFTGTNTCADIHIHPTGAFLYGSNRGHDSIAVFALEQQTGKLSAIAHSSSGGKCPRNFALTPGGKFLLAANQQTNNVVTFAIDPTNGTLTATGDAIQLPQPVCIKIMGDQ